MTDWIDDVSENKSDEADISYCYFYTLDQLTNL